MSPKSGLWVSSIQASPLTRMKMTLSSPITRMPCSNIPETMTMPMLPTTMLKELISEEADPASRASMMLIM